MSPLGAESTDSASEPNPLDQILSTADESVLEEYDLAPPSAPEDPEGFDGWWSKNSDNYSFQQPQEIDSWYEENKDSFDPVVSTGNEMQDFVNISDSNKKINEAYNESVFKPAVKAYEQSIEASYTEEVYQPYMDSFDAYKASLSEYNERMPQSMQRLAREATAASFNAGIESGDFSGLQLNPEKPDSAPVLLDGNRISYRTSYNTSDMLQGLSLSDGSIDEYLNSELDFNSEEQKVQADLEAAKARRDSYQSSLRSVPRDKFDRAQGDGVLREIESDIKRLEGLLDESGNITNNYKKELKANRLKQFMQENMMAKLNKTAELLGYQKGSKEWEDLAKQLEAEVWGASTVGGDYYEISKAFEGTAVGPNMFKFTLDENNVIGTANSWWDDAATSWSIGTLELQKQLDALDTAMGLEAYGYPEGTNAISVGVGLGPVSLTTRSYTGQRKREEDHQKKRKEIEAEQYKLQLELTQYATNAKSFELFGEDAIMSEADMAGRGLLVREGIGRQVAMDIERSYSIEAIQSMPVSLALMAPGLAAAPLTGGMSTAAAFAATSIPTFAFTTAMVGSDRYYGSMNEEALKDLSAEDRWWFSLRHGMYEGFGEAVSAGTVGVAGKLLKASRFSPYLPTRFASGSAMDVTARMGRGAAGIVLGTGIGVAEESAAEYVTGFAQGFDQALVEGKSLNEAFLVGKELGSHGANVGKYMGVLPGGSVVVEQAKASYMRVFQNEKFQDTVASAALQQFMNDALPARARKNLEDLRGKLSEDYLMSPTKSDRAVLSKIESELNRIDSNNAQTREALERLGKSNPALVADMLVANNYHQFLENVRLGGGKLDKNGKLRDWNGRFISEGNNPLYDFAQGMSKEKRTELLQAYNKGGKRIQSIAFGLLAFSGKNKIGVDTFGGVVTEQGQDWKDKGFDDAREVVINGDEEIDTSQFTAAEIKVLQKFIDQAKKSGKKVSIVLHNDESLSYINGEGVRSEAPVPFRNELLTEGLYMERPDGSHEIHLHKDTDLNRVAFHEYTHFFLEPLFQSNPEMLYDLAEEIRGLKSERVQSLVKAADMQGAEGDRGTRDRELITALFEAMAEGEFIRSDNPIEGFEISDLGVGAVLRNMFSKVAGFPDATTDSDLINLVLRFKNFAEGGSLGQVYTTPDQVDAAKEISEAEQGQPLSSKRFLENTEFFWKENINNFGERTNIPDLFMNDREKSRVFKDYYDFMKWYNRMTGNGQREGVIRDIHVFKDGKRMNLNYPKPFLDKDGKPKFMRPVMLTYKERKINENFSAIDTGREVSIKKAGVSQEISRIQKNNFTSIPSGDRTFTISMHDFMPESPSDYVSDLQGAQMQLQQRNNMLALLNSGIDLVEAHAKAQAKSSGPVYILDKSNAPGLFNLADQFDFMTKDEANALLEFEANQYNLNVWELLPQSSIHRRRRSQDVSSIPEDELVYATIRMEEIKDGADFIVEGVRGLKSDSLKYKDVKKSAIGPSIKITEAQAAEMQVKGGAPVIWAETRKEALYKTAEVLSLPALTFTNNMMSKALLYDRTFAGLATWQINNKKGEPVGTFNQNQIGGPYGAIQHPDDLLSSHIDPASATSMTVVPDWAKYIVVDIALRAPENTLRSPKTIEMFFRYVNQYYTQNKAAAKRGNYQKDLIASINEMLVSKVDPIQKRMVNTRETQVVEFKATRFGKILNHRSLKNAPGIKIARNSVKIQSEEGLVAFLDFMSNLPAGVNTSIGFGGRATMIKEVTKAMAKKGHKGFITADGILETMNDPRLQAMGDAGTGRIVASYVAKAPGLTTERMTDTEGESHNNGFPEAVFAQEGEVAYAVYDTSSDADVIYNPEKDVTDKRFGTTMQQSSKISRGSQALKSRRLGGRVYTEGNSSWEKSTATPYGEMLAHFTTRFQDKYSDVMLLQQDVEAFMGQKVPENQDFEMAIDLFYGKVREDMESVTRTLEGIGKSLKDNNQTVEDLSDLLYALHAKERNAHIKSKRADLESGSGMTDEEADAIIDELMSPEIMESVNMVYDLIADTRKTMVDGGLESQKVVSHWESLFKNYVPLTGLAADEQSEESNSYPTGGGGFSVYGRSGKKAKGRKSRTGTNLVASAVMQNMAIKQRARKDEATRSLHELVKNNPNDNVWRTYSEKNPMTKLADDGSQQKMRVEEMRANRNMVPVRINGEQHFIYFKDQEYANALNGLTEEETGSAVKNMGKYISLLREFATVYNPAFFVKNYMRDVGSALFNAMSEAERDGGIMTGFGLKPERFAKDVVATSLKMLRPLLREGVFGQSLDAETAKLLQEWKEEGGRTGWSYSESIEQIQNRLVEAADNPSATKKILKGFYQGSKVFEYIEGINEAFENAIRFAAYVEARKVGASKGQSAQLSKNITVNFNRAGEAAPSYNSMYLFFNAAAQSAARFTRTMATPKATLPGQNGQSDSWFNRATAPAKLAGGVVAFEVMKTMFNIAMSGEDESGELYYNTIPDYIKERNTILFYGDGPNDYIKLPIPYGYNMFNNIGMTIGELSSGQRSIAQAATFLGLGSMNSFSPLGFGQGKNVIERIGLGFLPTALRFPVDLYANVSFTGSQIIREQYPFGAPVPEWTLSFRSPEVVKKLAEHLNSMFGDGTENISGTIDINPDPYAYLISSYTAGLGKTVSQVAGLGRTAFHVAKRKAERLSNTEGSEEFLEELLTVREEDTVPLKRKDIPFINIVYGSENAYYSFDVFTENVNELGQYTREIKEGESTSTSINFVGVQALNERLKETQKSLGLIREAKKKARDIEDYIDRLNAIHKLEEAELLEVKLFNKSYYELRGQYIDPRSRNAITNAL